MENNLQDKLLKTLKTFTVEIGSIKEQCINDVNINLDKVEDLKMKAFLNESLEAATKGKLTANDFINQFKEFQ